MSAEIKDPAPLLVKVVEEKRAPQRIVGAAVTYTPVAATRDTLPECILQYSMRRSRALVSIVGTGVIALGTNQQSMINGVGTRGVGSLIQGPALFELLSTNDWYVALASGANTTVSVIAETEVDG